MGNDGRNVSEIIDSDLAEISRLGLTVEQVARRMREITEKAIPGLGGWVQIDEKRQAKADEAKGPLVCPWPHAGRFAKRVTTVKLVESGETIKWSDLNIHLIEEHGFFEGKGSAFRIEPGELIQAIF